MSGKAYTMQEMRDVVAYLVEKHAYAETRARTMWVDFANSGRTKRTWQSLKETFLKRILPDIHNPYFKLTPEQIQSFRRGKNLVKSNTNKLEFQEIPSAGISAQNEAGPSRQIDPVGDTGENLSEKDINSTETKAEMFAVAEEVLKSLEEKEKHEIITPKSLKDRVAAALTPVMSVMADWDVSDFTEQLNKGKNKLKEALIENTENTTSSISQDTPMPLNKELEYIPTHSMTRSQSQKCMVNNIQPLKSSLKSKDASSNSESLKKTVRLSDVMSEPDENCIEENVIVSETGKGNAKENSKQDISTKMHELTDSNLPNNQEKINNIPGDSVNANYNFNTASTTDVPNVQIESETQDFEPPAKRTRSATSQDKFTPEQTEPSAKTISPKKGSRKVRKSQDSLSQNDRLPSPFSHVERTPSPVSKNSEKAKISPKQKANALKSQKIKQVEMSSDDDEKSENSNINNENKRNELATQDTENSDNAKSQLIINGNENEIIDEQEIQTNKTPNDNCDDEITPSGLNEQTDNAQVEKNNTESITVIPQITTPEKSNVNPCLLSASLFEENPISDEQNKGIKIDSEMKNNVTTRYYKNDMVLLGSHSSESEISTEPVAVNKRKADSVCAKLFGTTGHGYTRNKGKPSKYKRPRKRSRRSSASSDSSDYESSDCEETIPLPRPNGRNKRMHRPANGSIKMLSDGALVAVCKGKLYSLVAQRGDKVYNLKYNLQDIPEDKNAEIRLASNSPILPSCSAKLKEHTVPQNRDPEARAQTNVAPTVQSEHTCLTVTKDKISLAGDMDKIMTALPKLQQAMREMRAGMQEVGEGAREVLELSDAETKNSEASDDVRARVDAKEAEIFKEIAERDEEEKKQTENVKPRKSARAKRPPRTLSPSPPLSKASSESETEIIIQDEPQKKKRGKQKRPPVEVIEESDSDKTLYSLPPKQNRRAAKVGDYELSLESSQGYRDTDESVIVVKSKAQRKLTYHIDQRRRSSSVTRQRRNIPYHRPVVRKRKVVARKLYSSDDENEERNKKARRKQEKVINKDAPHLTPIQETLTSQELNVEETDSNEKVNNSNVTLPPSPEISIVENISIRASSIHEKFNINPQLENTVKSKNVSIVDRDVDISHPLMEQDFSIRITDNSPRFKGSSSLDEMEICVTNYENEILDKHNPTVTDSLISKVTSVKIDDSTDSVVSVQDFNTQFISTIKQSPKDYLRVSSIEKVKSRSSTPNKKSKLRKSKPLTVIEEDHVEYCARVRPQSCPGAVDINPKNTKNKNRKSQTESFEPIQLNKWKIRTPIKPKPKIIKVKIEKPKKDKENIDNKNKHKRKTIDVNISNESDQTSNETVDTDLIHNHSDSCLNGFECMANDSNLPVNFGDSGVAFKMHTLTPSPDCFDSDARDGSTETKSIEGESSELRLSNIGSLLTNDSYESAHSGIISNDDDAMSPRASYSYGAEERELIHKYGRDIVKLFPLTCAVPHLSTITEASSDTRESN